MKTYTIAKNTIVSNNWELIPYTRLVAGYLETLASSNQHTLRAKRSDLNFWLAFLGRDLGSFMKILLGEVTEELAISFPMYRLAQGDSPATVCRRLATLKAFDKFISRHVSEYKPVFWRVSGPTFERNNFEGISSAHAKALINAAYNEGHTDFLKARNGFAIAFILATGLRVSEALAVKENQIKHSWIKKLRCKGNYYRDIFIPASITAEVLPAYLVKRRAQLTRLGIAKTNHLPLIISKQGKQMHYKTLWRIVCSAAAGTKLGHVRPHQLRHTRAHEVLENTNDVRLVAQMLGHKSLETTMRYTERSKAQMEEKLNNARD